MVICRLAYDAVQSSKSLSTFGGTCFKEDRGLTFLRDISNDLPACTESNRMTVMLKVKYFPCLIKHHPTRMHRVWRYLQLEALLTQAIGGSEQLTSRPGSLSWENSPGTIGQEAKWVPEFMWTLSRNQQSLPSDGNRKPISRPSSPQSKTFNNVPLRMQQSAFVVAL